MTKIESCFLSFFPSYIHHSQHKTAIYCLRGVASRVAVTKNNWKIGSDKNTYELITEVTKCMWIEKESDQLSIDLISWIDILFKSSENQILSIDYHSSLAIRKWHLLFSFYNHFYPSIYQLMCIFITSNVIS